MWWYFDRLLSEYIVYDKENEKSADDFDERATVAVNSMNECLLNRTLRSCVYDIQLAAKTLPV